MKFCLTLSFLVFLLVSGCANKTRQSIENKPGQAPAVKSNNYWKEVSEIMKTSLSCPGRVLPTRYTIYEVNYPELRKLLLTKGRVSGSLNLDTTRISVPIPNGSPEEFEITQVQVLPPELSEKYPEIKTYHGKSIVYPEDNIRLDISPKGISIMILSTRGTIIMDPFCNTDSIHVITYFKKDLPEGGKEDFEK